MINENIYSKLTPSAKEAIDELSEQFKENLLEKAYQIATDRDTANKEISLRDILEANQTSDRLRILDKVEFKRKRLLTTVSFSGIIYATAGFIIYLYQNNKFSLDKDIGLIIAVVGLLITLFAVFYSQLISRRYILDNLKSTDTSDNFDLVKRWQLIESLAKKLMSDADQKESSSVSFLIRFLSHRVAKDEKEYLKIKDLLQLRNKIIHEQYRPSTSEKREYIDFADELIKRLEEAKKETRDTASITVISAIYGTRKNSIDLTTQLNQLIKNNRLEFVISNEIAGDPEHGVVKDFKIIYEINGQRVVKDFKEGEKVSIPS
jgi:hypothetical protein